MRGVRRPHSPVLPYDLCPSCRAIVGDVADGVNTMTKRFVELCSSLVAVGQYMCIRCRKLAAEIGGQR